MTRGRFSFVFGLAMVAWPRAATADVKQECSAAYEKVQIARQSGHLVEARREVVTCARDACADFIKADCAKWIGEIDASLPTIVITAHDPKGAESLAVRTSIDGNVVTDKLDGRSMPIDPGSHQLRFEMAGAQTIDETLIIVQGVKDRRVDLVFQVPVAAPHTVDAVPAIVAPISPATETRRPAWAWGVTGVGIALVVASVGLFAAGAVNAGQCNNPPAGMMCALRVSSTAFYAPGGVAAGLGLGALGVGIYGLTKGPPPRRPAMRVRPTSYAGGGRVVFEGTF